MTAKLRRILRSFKIDEISGLISRRKRRAVVLLKRDSSRDEPRTLHRNTGLGEWLISKK